MFNTEILYSVFLKYAARILFLNHFIPIRLPFV